MRSLPVDIKVDQARQLRRSILRPHQEAHALIYPGDDAPETFHLGLLEGDNLLGVLSMFQEPKPGQVSPAWRIRGMACLPEVRGKGIGRQLVLSARDRAWSSLNAPIWCNARESACGFYARIGFTVEGSPFELEGIGPHERMVLAPPPSRPTD